MSTSSTGLYGSATIVNSDLFNDVETLKEQVTTLSTSYLDTTREHREDISKNRLDISSNLNKINNITDLSDNRIKDIEEYVCTHTNTQCLLYSVNLKLNMGLWACIPACGACIPACGACIPACGACIPACGAKNEIKKYRAKGLCDVVAKIHFGEVSAISNRRPRDFDFIPGVNNDILSILVFALDSDADFLQFLARRRRTR